MFWFYRGGYVQDYFLAGCSNFQVNSLFITVMLPSNQQTRTRRANKPKMLDYFITQG